MLLDNYHKKFITLFRTRVYCEYSLSDKPPILLIHGFVSSTRSFHRIMSLLEQHFSVVAIDLIGFGKSEKSTTFIYSYVNYAKLIKACMDYFQFAKATIVGHSMGGQISLYTARLFPERVNHLILLATSSYLGRSRKSLIISSYLPFFHCFAKRMIGQQDVRGNLRNVLNDPSLITANLIEEYGRPLQDDNFYKALIRLLRHREGDLSSKELQKIYTPSLIIWGEKDKVIPFHVGKRLVNDLPMASLVSYKNTGHLLTEERPHETVNHMLRFIKRDNNK